MNYVINCVKNLHNLCIYENILKYEVFIEHPRA